MKKATKFRMITRGISLPARVEAMALSKAGKYGQSVSAYIRSLIIRDHFQKP